MTLKQQPKTVPIGSGKNTTPSGKVTAHTHKTYGHGMPTTPTYNADVRFMADGTVKQADTLKVKPSEHTLKLVELLRYRRPSQTVLQDAFVKDYLMPRLLEIPAVDKDDIHVDDYGNVRVEIYTDMGNPSSVMFTAHVDTVHNSFTRTDKSTPYQEICWDAKKNVLFKADDDCLGADDGTGIYILLHMIRNNVPGMYCFFLDEEIGRKGSTAFKDGNVTLSGIDKVVSFDRMNATDIITRQRGGTCASDAFAKELGKRLKAVNGLDYRPSPNGSFTDSATFMDDIAECTNVSVGYKNQHTGNETQNMQTLESLLKGVVAIDWETLPVERDPAKEADFDFDYGYDMFGSYGSSYTTRAETRSHYFYDELEAFCESSPAIEDTTAFIQDHPNLVARALFLEGYDAEKLMDLIDEAVRK